MIAKLIGGCYLSRSAGVVTVRSNRESTVRLTARRSGDLVLCLLPTGALDSVAAVDEASLCRWVSRLAVEFNAGVEVIITTTTETK